MYEINNELSMVELSSYKLVEFLKKYINPEGIEISIVIYFCIAQILLRKLGFVYKEVRKDVFIDGYEQPDMMEDQNCILIKIEKLKPYMIEFNEDGVMKTKDYPVNYKVGGEKRCPIILIIHNKCTFFANNGIRKAWTRKGDTFL